jgi:putative ABC transport system permease protein
LCLCGSLPGGIMETLWQDLRYGFKILLKKPGFTFIAVLALALGIGANSAIFSVINAVLLKPLPFEEPDRLITVWEINPKQGSEIFNVSYPNFSDWKAENRVFEKIAAYRMANLILSGEEEPERLGAAIVTADLFQIFGARPALGRTFLPEEDETGGNQVVIISQNLWQRRFGSDPGLIGKSIKVNSGSFTVVGIMPADFQFPTDKTDLWIPLGPLKDQMKNRGVHIITVIGRLKPQVTFQEARADIETIAAKIQNEKPGEDTGHGVKLLSLHELIVGDIRTPLLVLLGAVVLVLLIACSNVANLLLASATVRQREIAIRTALGAGRWRVIRQLLTESMILAMLGGAAGLLIAVWGLDLMVGRLPDYFPRVKEIYIDRHVLGFTFATSLLTGFVFGLFPAIKMSRPELNEALKESSGKQTGISLNNRFRSALVVSEIALSLVLLIGGGLMIKSLWSLMQVNPGFKADNLLTMTVSLPSKYGEDEKVISYFRQLSQQLGSLPGVKNVSAVSALPISGGDSNGNVTVEGRVFPPGETQAASFRRILPNYFSTMGIPLLRGREFDERDTGQDPKVVIINETMARRFWPDEDPIGKRIKIGPPENEPWLTVVGVVGDVRNIGLNFEPNLSTYEPHAQRSWNTMNLVIRTVVDPLSLSEAVRKVIRDTDKDIPIYNIGTMDKRISLSVSDRRFNMLILGIFAVVALLLSTLGIYGVMSYYVTQRTHEIGIRMALGAQPFDMLKMVIKQGATLTLIGLGVGLVASFALTRVLSSLLFKVSTTDPITFASVSLILGLVALSACYLPARKATRVDPMVALRYE